MYLPYQVHFIGLLFILTIFWVKCKNNLVRGIGIVFGWFSWGQVERLCFGTMELVFAPNTTLFYQIFLASFTFADGSCENVPVYSTTSISQFGPMMIFFPLTIFAVVYSISISSASIISVFKDTG
jgi:hypothetical protein